MQYRN